MRGKLLLGSAAAIILIVSFIFIKAYLNTSWEIANLPPKNDVIVAFGDSLVYGVGATKGNDLVSLLSKRTGREIINMGVPGDTSADGLGRLDEVLAHDPGIVILLLGGNDALRRIEGDETRNNISAILSTLIENKTMVILVGVRGGLLSDPYDTMYEELARTYGAMLVPNILEGILLDPELTKDQIHPNDAGYVLVADRIYQALADVI